MRFTWTFSDNVKNKIKIEGETVETVEEFWFLGALFTNDDRDIKEIWFRIEMAKNAFMNFARCSEKLEAKNENKA